MTFGRNSPAAWVGAALLLAASAAAAAKQPSVDDATLEFRLPDLQGRIVSLSDDRFAGKVVLVDLWATWCPPCITEIPTLIDLQGRFGDRGLAIVAVAFEVEELPETRRQRLTQFAEEHGINYLVIDGGPSQDFESALPAVRNVRGFPVEILIDRTGRVATARNGYGYKKSWVRKLTREIESLLGEPPEPE